MPAAMIVTSHRGQARVQADGALRHRLNPHRLAGDWTSCQSSGQSASRSLVELAWSVDLPERRALEQDRNSLLGRRVFEPV
jgi:hypothetical protein